MRLRFGAVTAAGLAAVLAGCSGTAPPREIAAPDIAKITVFYPVDGLVRGRGGAGTFADPSISSVIVSAHPTGTETILPIEQDGSFDFSIIALSDDVLEIAGARDGTGKDRGEVAYIRVPPLAPARPHFFCCGEPSGTCTSEEQFKSTMTCADPLTGAMRCADVRGCRDRNFEILPLNRDRVQVSPPDADGKVTINGVIETPGALVRVENRGQRALGGRDPGVRLAQISDTAGIFQFRGVQARGDDELVIQVNDLLGNKSPQASVLVPDAKPAGFDVIGAYPFDRLENGKIGTVALRFHPHGLDGRGICPDSAIDPLLCFTGGLTHEMVDIEAATFDERASPNPRSTPISLNRPSNRGTEGDPLAKTQMIVVVIDNSAQATTVDQDPPRRFDAAAQFIRTLRKRDSVGIISYGGPSSGPNNRRDLAISPSGGDWAAQLGAISSIASRPAEGSSDIFGAIRAAGALLDEQNDRNRPGTIVVISTGDASGTMAEASEAFDLAYDQIRPDQESGFRGYGVYVIGVAVPEPVQMNGVTVGNIRLLESIAAFSADGRFVNIPAVQSLAEALGDAAGYISGSYVLLYEMAIPDSVGKSARLRITASVNIPSSNGGTDAATGTYEGPIRIDGSVL